MRSYADCAVMLKALADETRLKIIDILSCGQMCACKILEAFEITQPTLSYHMKILTGAGLVTGVRDGAWMHYSLNQENIEGLKGFISELTAPKDACICRKCKS